MNDVITYNCTEHDDLNIFFKQVNVKSFLRYMIRFFVCLVVCMYVYHKLDNSLMVSSV